METITENNKIARFAETLMDVISTNVDNGEQIKQLSVHRDEETRRRTELHNTSQKIYFHMQIVKGT